MYSLKINDCFGFDFDAVVNEWMGISGKNRDTVEKEVARASFDIAKYRGYSFDFCGDKCSMVAMVHSVDVCIAGIVNESGNFIVSFRCTLKNKTGNPNWLNNQVNKAKMLGCTIFKTCHKWEDLEILEVYDCRLAEELNIETPETFAEVEDIINKLKSFKLYAGIESAIELRAYGVHFNDLDDLIPLPVGMRYSWELMSDYDLTDVAVILEDMGLCPYAYDAPYFNHAAWARDLFIGGDLSTVPVGDAWYLHFNK